MSVVVVVGPISIDDLALSTQSCSACFLFQMEGYNINFSASNMVEVFVLMFCVRPKKNSQFGFCCVSLLGFAFLFRFIMFLS